MPIDLLLANPLFLSKNEAERELMSPYFPLGLLYLAATARQAGYQVSVFDGMFESGDQAFAATLERERPRVVGISVLSTVRGAALRLAELERIEDHRRRLNRIHPVLWGGIVAEGDWR